MRKTPKISIERLFGQELAQGWETDSTKGVTKFPAFCIFAHHKVDIQIVE